MSKPLVVVESPTKVRTIKKVLGAKYNVAATVGHIKDLPAREIGIDIDNDFKPTYKTISGKQRVITDLRRAAGDTMDVYLAPDPDREGEAIAWHTADVLKKKQRRFHRVLFHELTAPAIRSAMDAPRDLDNDKYDAQQARRILDRLVGYQVSPLLWRKVKSGLSAGRVQTVALRIVCEREKAIQAFEPEEYWSITGHLAGDVPPAFTAKLVRKDGEKIRIGNEQSVKEILQGLDGQPFVVAKVQKKTQKRNPLPPFTTSKLQQEAIRKLRFTAKKTMMVAQQLYEGVDLGPGEPEGLITYMRTDSTRIAEEAAQEAIDYVRETHGSAFAIAKPRQFKNKKKVQDAHEAIRPTSVQHTPEKIAAFLTKDQMALYQLIWRRFVASQMAPALIDRNLVAINCDRYGFNASGSTVKFKGFMSVYLSVEQESTKKGEKPAVLPELTVGQQLALQQIEPKQHFTLPPPRFTEASLVKELEENGIGRPSTYAAILSTIRDKGYVDLLKGQFRPSELGFIVNHLLVTSFPDIFDVAFTARLEDDLDKVETAETDAIRVLQRFYDSFKNELEEAAVSMQSMRGVGLPTEMTCPDCGKGILHVKVGKNGEYLACNQYPECRYTRNYSRDEKGRIQAIDPIQGEVSDQKCTACDRPMVVRQGRYGPFLACSGYPDCKNTQSLNQDGTAGKIGVACPEEGCGGELVEKKSRRGKIFYSCNRYPDCKFATWDKPVGKACPQCDEKYMLEKTTKKSGTHLACPNKSCGFRQPVEN